MAPALCAGAAALALGDNARAATVLEAALADLPRIGGSHAQREVFEDSLIIAYLRSAQPNKAAHCYAPGWCGGRRHETKFGLRSARAPQTEDEAGSKMCPRSLNAGPIVRAFRRPENTCDQHRQDAGQKNSVEGSGPADRSDRRPQPLHLVQVEKISSD